MIRWGTTVVGLGLAAPLLADGDWSVAAWLAAVVAYAAIRTVSPIRYVDDTASLVRVLAEVAVHVLAVISTGYWDSPFVFSLITAVIVAGFARGFGFGLRVGAASAVAVALPDISSPGYTFEDFRVSAQWAVELLLVALVAGYGRRISGEADRQHSLALDRLGRLADANELLFSLHRVAQTLPQSLDLDDVLDSTIGRLHDLFDYDAAAVMLFDDTDHTWAVVRKDGTRLPAKVHDADLPGPVRRALDLHGCTAEPNLLSEGGPGLAPSMGSGLYAALAARGSTIGLLSLEHRESRHYSSRDIDLLDGFIRPAALAIDNARWFGRLRTVGADEERTRIARDLHDRIGQSLAYLAFELDRIVKATTEETTAGRADVGESLERLRGDVRGVIREVRDTLYDLRTDVSDDKDFPDTLDEFLGRVQARADMEITFRTHVENRLPLLQEREMWRIAQEAVTNVERHAGADHATVVWHCDADHARLEVVDDGIGFPDGTTGRLDSYGLMGMRERASSIGALLDVTSEPGRGTRVRCVLDLHH